MRVFGLAVVAASVSLSACASAPGLGPATDLLPSIHAPPLISPSEDEPGEASEFTLEGDPQTSSQSADRPSLMTLEAIPATPSATPRSTQSSGGELIDAVTTTAWPESLPEFIEVIFGEVLQVPFDFGPSVAERDETVNFNVSDPLTADALLDAVRVVLSDYGLAVIEQNGVYRIVESERFWRAAPDFVVSRSSSDTPADLRPVVQIVNLRAMLAGRALQLINRTFPDDRDIVVTGIGEQNALVFRGLPDKVRTAVDIVVSLDEPRFTGAIIQSFVPRYWTAVALRDRVERVLNAEGIQVGDQNESRALVLLAVAETNEVLIFAESRQLVDRAVYWLTHLDNGAQGGDEARLYMYTVRNTAASNVAATVNALLMGTPQSLRSRTGGGSEAAASAAAPDAGAGQAQGVSTISGGRAGGPLVVDIFNNALLFEGSAVEWQRILPLVEQMDRPAPEVLIEVIVAEVTLSDDQKSGVEWLLDDIEFDDNATYSIGTLGGLGLQAGGLSATLQGADAQALISAVRESSRVSILSTPRLAARSGGEAEFNVGTEVPVITSQRASGTQTEGGTDILQSVQYRRTGNILTFAPIVYGSGRIDIDISLEVSEAQSNSNQAISSPIILNRSVRTQLSLEDGALAVIGGLISSSQSNGENAVPGVSRIPLLGRAFRTDTDEARRSELILLIRPYLIRTGDDRSALVDALQSSVSHFTEMWDDEADY
jgi:general secretion pathway protein D